MSTKKEARKRVRKGMRKEFWIFDHGLDLVLRSAHPLFCIIVLEMCLRMFLDLTRRSYRA